MLRLGPKTTDGTVAAADLLLMHQDLQAQYLQAQYSHGNLLTCFSNS